MDKWFLSIGKGFVIMTVAAAIGLLVSWPIKWTWNATMPDIFGLIQITWGQAWCLSYLTGQFIQSTFSHAANE